MCYMYFFFPQTYFHFHKGGEAVVLLQEHLVGIPYLGVLTSDRWSEGRRSFDLSGVLEIGSIGTLVELIRYHRAPQKYAHPMAG